jgi:hypothetical protein
VTSSDEQELRRLTSLLEHLHQQAKVDADTREALQKAALALSVSFMHGLRAEVEKLYATLGKPLPAAAREHLRRLGIDPERDEEQEAG